MEERIAKRSRKYIAQHPLVEIENDRTKVVSERRLLAEQHGLRLSAAEVLSGHSSVRTFTGSPLWPLEKAAGQRGPADTRPYEQKLVDPVAAWNKDCGGSISRTKARCGGEQ
jgi:hypothetical protein